MSAQPNNKCVIVRCLRTSKNQQRRDRLELRDGEYLSTSISFRALPYLLLTSLLCGCQSIPPKITQQEDMNEYSSQQPKEAHGRLDSTSFEDAAEIATYLPPNSIVAVKPFSATALGSNANLGERVNDYFKQAIRKARPDTEFVDRSVMNAIYDEWTQSGRNPDNSQSVEILQGKTLADFLMIGDTYETGTLTCVRFEIYDLTTTRSIAGSNEVCSKNLRPKVVRLVELRNLQGADDSYLSAFAIDELQRTNDSFEFVTDYPYSTSSDYQLKGEVLSAKISIDYIRDAPTASNNYVGALQKKVFWADVVYRVQLDIESSGGLNTIGSANGTASKRASSLTDESVDWNRIVERALRSAVRKLWSQLQISHAVPPILVVSQNQSKHCNIHALRNSCSS